MDVHLCLTPLPPPCGRLLWMTPYNFIVIIIFKFIIVAFLIIVNANYSLKHESERLSVSKLMVTVKNKTGISKKSVTNSCFIVYNKLICLFI